MTMTNAGAADHHPCGRKRKHPDRDPDGGAAGERGAETPLSTDAATPPAAGTAHDAIAPKENEGRRTRDEKVVLVAAYLGGAYRGSARNDRGDAVSTVEGCLWRAVSGALAATAAADAPNATAGDGGGARAECSFHAPLRNERTNPRAMTRSSRTDKGVSALGNVWGLHVPMSSGTTRLEEEEWVSLVNERLPDDIRLLRFMTASEGDKGAARGFQNFDARKCCDARRYRYIVPARVLLKASREREGGAAVEEESTMDLRKRLKKILLRWGGTHSFHNFTSAAVPGNSDAVGGDDTGGNDPNRRNDHYKRHIMRCHVEDVTRHNGRDYVVISIKGSSFMRHQIRKMVGATIGVANGTLPEDYIEVSLDEGTTAVSANRREEADGTGGVAPTVKEGAKERGKVIDEVPLAPAEGLVLAEAIYSRHCSKHRLESIGLGTKLFDRAGASKQSKGATTAPRELSEEILAFHHRIHERICSDQEANYFGSDSATSR